MSSAPPAPDLLHFRVPHEHRPRPSARVPDAGQVGVLAGGTLVGAGAVKLSGGGLSLAQVALLVAYAGVMLAVCLLACIVPTRRALSVEPTEALRGD